MESVIDTTGIDMNDATNLAFYTQLLQYKMNPSLPETMFKDPNNSQQRTLHSLAHAMGLEYEYSIMTRTVIITRQTQSTKTIFTEDRAFDFNEFIDFGPSKASDILWNDSCGFPIAMSSPSTHPGYNSSPMYRPVTPSGQMHVPNSTTIKILGRKDQGSASFSGPESVMSDAGSIDVSAMDPNLDLVFSVSPPSSETITWGSQSLLGLYGQSNRVSDKPPSPPTDTIKSPKIFNFLCSFEGCARGIPGSGFPRYWNLRDHVKRVHNSSPSPQSKYIDEINSSVGHASNHNGDAKGSSRYTSYMTRLATGNSYPTYSSADEVMFTSPMDVMPQAVLESSITHDDVSAAIDPMNINDSLWAWDEVGQPESGGSASFFPDMAWLTGVATKNPMNYSPNRAVNSLSHGSVDNDNTPRDHPLYQKATTDPDGLYHCPWEGKDPSCNHMPEKLKCNYDKFVDSHLKPYRCKVHACENARFSSTAYLLQHEREAHAMHGHREKPFLCTFEGCERGVPGNGFPRHWNLCDHMKRIHNRYPSPQTGGAKPPRRSKESKSSTSESTTTEKTRVPASSLSWSEQYQHGHQQLMSDLMDIPDLGDVEAAEQEIKIATDYLKLMARATQQMKPVPWMEQTISKQSPSVHSLASSGYQEIIFDSNSAHSSSHGSACSGRSGPLDKVAITAMRLVKAVGACWKCKFLRKKCKPEAPCEECLKNNRNSHWNPIGCKRGTLKSEMYLIKLCKGSDGWQPSAYTWQAVERANGSLQKAIQRREQGLMMFGLMMASQAEVTSDFTETTYVHFFLEFLPGTRYSPTKQPLPSTLAPLNECILAILWELRNADPPLSILPKGTLHEFVNLLQAAALFQSINESDQLIAQSLICLRSCLEVMHVKETASFQDFSHSDCSKTFCQFICIADLDLHLTLYLNELDRVFFCKENQHYKESWWLPAFYSFCIQGMVRNALMGILIPDLTGRNSKISQHLYLGVRLFIAASGAYDPLIEYSSPDPGLLSVDSCEKIRKDRYKLAQVAVGRAQWMSRGIESSADYLKKLFEDDGEVLLK